MIVIYHNADLDGLCSAAICKRKYPDAKLIGYHYGNPIPWEEIPEMESVIMVDVSWPMKQMHELLDHSGDLTWIDHHKSAIEESENYPNWPDYAAYRFTKVLRVGPAACELAWEYLFPEEAMPAAVSLLGKYDTWRGHGTPFWENQILPFQYAMRLQCTKPEEFPMYQLSDRANVDVEIKDYVDRGQDILRYQRQQDERAMHASFESELNGLRAICCNAGGTSSTAFDSVYDPEEHDIMVGFRFNKDKWVFSLRGTKDWVDCSFIAKKFGGGGHAKAAGFSANKLEDVLTLPQKS